MGVPRPESTAATAPGGLHGCGVPFAELLRPTARGSRRCPGSRHELTTLDLSRATDQVAIIIRFTAVRTRYGSRLTRFDGPCIGVSGLRVSELFEIWPLR